MSQSMSMNQFKDIFGESIGFPRRYPLCSVITTRFERPEGMLNSPFSDAHHFRCPTESAFPPYGFMLPTSYSSFRPRRALRFQRVSQTFLTCVI
jgi:hypothetical protein